MPMPGGVALHAGDDRDLGLEQRPHHAVGRRAEVPLEVSGPRPLAGRHRRPIGVAGRAGADLGARAEVVAAPRITTTRIASSATAPVDRVGDRVEHGDGHRVALLGTIERDAPHRAVVVHGDVARSLTTRSVRAGRRSPRSCGVGREVLRSRRPTSTSAGSSSGWSSTHTWGRCSSARWARERIARRRLARPCRNTRGRDRRCRSARRAAARSRHRQRSRARPCSLRPAAARAPIEPAGAATCPVMESTRRPSTSNAHTRSVARLTRAAAGSCPTSPAARWG